MGMHCMLWTVLAVHCMKTVHLVSFVHEVHCVKAVDAVYCEHAMHCLQRVHAVYGCMQCMQCTM